LGDQLRLFCGTLQNGRVPKPNLLGSIYGGLVLAFVSSPRFIEEIIATNLLRHVIPYTDCNVLIHRCGAVFSLASGCVHDDNALCRRQARRCADVTRDAHRDEKLAAKARLRCLGHSRKSSFSTISHLLLCLFDITPFLLFEKHHIGRK